MDEILRTGCAENIKNSSFKNYKSISIKLFNIINKKNNYNENMSEEEIMIGFGKLVNKFFSLQEYLEDEKNNFKTSTKKNYINNLLNIILKINNIDNYCIKKKKKLEEIKLAIKNYWIKLRKDIDIINLAKKQQNEIEKTELTTEEKKEIDEYNESYGVEPQYDIENETTTSKTEFNSISSEEVVDNDIKLFQLNNEIHNLFLQDALLKEEMNCINNKREIIKNTIQELMDKKEEL